MDNATYQVAIKSADGHTRTFPCGGSSNQEALIYAGKVVEENAAEDGNAVVTISKDGEQIGPTATVAEITHRLN